MGAQNVLRNLTEAWLQAMPMDLSPGQTMQWIPQQNDTGSLQIGSATKGMDFKVFLGGNAKYFLLDRGTSTLQMRGLSLNTNATLVANTVNTNTISVTNGLTLDALNATTLNVTQTLTANTLAAQSITVNSGLTANALTCNTLTVQISGTATLLNATSTTATNLTILNTLTATTVTVTGNITGQTLTILPSADDTGTVTIGNSTLGMDFKIFAGGAAKTFLVDRGAQQITITGLPIVSNAAITTTGLLTSTGAIATTNVTATSVAATGDLAGASLQIIPAVDDTGAVTIGNSTLGMDFKVFLGGAATYFLLDRGLQKMILRGVELNTNSVIQSTSSITTTGAITAANVTATTTLGSGGALSADSLVIIPSVDDTGTIVFGNTTHSQDVKVFLGGSGKYVEFDRGASKMTLRGVELNTNAAIVTTSTVNSTGNVVCSTLNTNNINITGSLSFSGAGRLNLKVNWSNTNTTYNSVYYTALNQHNHSGVLIITLEDPASVPGVFFEGISFANIDVQFKSGAANSQRFVVVGSTVKNSVVINGIGKSWRFMSTGSKWVFQPYDGTTFTTT